MPEQALGVKEKLLQTLNVLYRCMFDVQVPWYVKLLLGLIIAYVISPIDLIPDFIPIIGLLDELILVPLGLALAIRLLPDELMEKYRNMDEQVLPPRFAFVGILLVLMVWVLLILLVLQLL